MVEEADFQALEFWGRMDGRWRETVRTAVMEPPEIGSVTLWTFYISGFKRDVIRTSKSIIVIMKH